MKNAKIQIIQKVKKKKIIGSLKELKIHRYE